MNKKSLVICFALILLLSVSFVSAGWFGDFWSKITGKQIQLETAEADLIRISETESSTISVIEGEKTQITSPDGESVIVSRLYVKDEGIRILVKSEESGTEWVESDETGAIQIGGEEYIVKDAKYGGAFGGIDKVDIVKVPVKPVPVKPIPVKPIPIEQVCTETDTGFDIYEKGSVNSEQGTVWLDQCGVYGSGIPQATDSCSGGNCFLFEQLCNPVSDPLILETTQTYDNVYSAKVNCLKGCLDGACLGCFDTDAGFDIYTKGSVNSEQGTVWLDQCIEYIGGVPSTSDGCFGENCYLFELLCNPVSDPLILETTQSYDGIYQAKVNCPNGCYKGVCEESCLPTGLIIDEIKSKSQEIFKGIKETTEPTSNLLSLNDKHLKTSSFLFFRKGKIKKELEKVTRERKTAMMKLAEINPVLFLKNVILGEEREKFPTNLREHIEEEVTLYGTIEIEHIDDITNQESETYYFLRLPKDERLQLYFAYIEPRILYGSEVQVRGWRLENKIVISPFKEQNFQIISEPFSSQLKTGQNVVKKVAVIRFNFQNDQREVYTSTEIKEKIFTGANSINAYYQEISYGKLSFEGNINADGDVFGYYTIPYDIESCDLSAWTEAAKTAATAEGFIEAEYTNIIYLFPHPGRGICFTWSGMASGIGSLESTETFENWVQFFRHDYPFLVITHELGHNFGVWHSASFECFDEQGIRTTISSDCAVEYEYGDLFDVMGKSLKHMNAQKKEVLGFFDSSNIQDVTSSGTYTITAIELSTNSVQVLQIPFEVDSLGNVVSSYIIEYRGPHGFDDFDVSDPVIHGVSIRLTQRGSSRSSLLLDNTPTTGSVIDPVTGGQLVDGFIDSALAVGESFQDTQKGITITTTNVTPNVSAQVYIELSNFQICVRANPLVSVLPCGQSGPAGGYVNYIMSITNKDSPSCSSSEFSIGPLSGPLSEGGGYVGQSGVLSLSPGEKGDAPFFVYSPLDAAPRSYRLELQGVRFFNYPPYVAGKGVSTWINILPPLPYEDDCADGIDNDNNGLIDCQEWDCREESYCAEDCTDGIDNNNNEWIDCQDYIFCWDNPICTETGSECTDTIDNDNDGYIDCSDWDCKDEVFSLIPTAKLTFGSCAEDCTDGIDNNNNGFIDCNDNMYCWDNSACIESICNDNIDNDNDGQTDCNDWDCSQEVTCIEDCSNTVDDNNNGLTDCQDWMYCSNDPSCSETGSECNDNIDNDNDSQIDCSDWDCKDETFCAEDCTDGIDNNANTLVDCQDWMYCSNDPSCSETGSECNDNIDNDNDGLTDCSDWDCREESYCAEDCTDGIDNNNNALVDCQDNMYCWDNPACIESICDDSIDNDNDGLTDCSDWDCKDETFCAEDCTDGIDNNNNGFIDCNDNMYCWYDPAC